MSGQTAGVVRIMAVLATVDDRDSLQQLFQCFRWRARFVENCANLTAAFQQFQPHVVITDSTLAEGEGWRDVLTTAQKQPGMPPVIVISRLADERLWAEVLNLGGYDLLLKPLDATEIQNVVCMACRARHNEMERSRPRVLKAS